MMRLKLKLFFKFCFIFFKSAIILGVPILSCPLPLILQTKESKCAWVIIIMAFYWIFEVIPLCITALIPVFLFPLLGIMGTKEVTVLYMKDVVMLLLSSLMFAVFVQLSNLHKRLALRVILFIGASPRRIILGLMLVTAFLSMWINNLASTALMIPIAEAILSEMNQGRSRAATHFSRNHENNHHLANNHHQDISITFPNSMPRSTNGPHQEQNSQNALCTKPCKSDTNLRIIMMLSISYSANIGGTGSPIGSPPNLILTGFLTSIYRESPLNFSNWMLMNAPQVVICILLGWVWLGVICLKTNDETDTDSRKSIEKSLRENYDSLGQISFQEKFIIAAFILLIILWFFRDPREITDVTSTILAILLLYIVPIAFKLPWDKWKCTVANERINSDLYYPKWENVSKKLPWGTCLIIGGGFAMSEGVKQSGLSRYISGKMTFFSSLPQSLVLLCVSIFTISVTEITSNAATANILLPVYAEMCNAINISPLFILLPATLCCSFAFMLPASTAPNTLAYEAGKMTTLHMVKYGIMMTVICVSVVNINMHTLGAQIFDLSVNSSYIKRNVSNV